MKFSQTKSIGVNSFSNVDILIRHIFSRNKCHSWREFKVIPSKVNGLNHNSVDCYRLFISHILTDICYNFRNYYLAFPKGDLLHKNYSRVSTNTTNMMGDLFWSECADFPEQLWSAPTFGGVCIVRSIFCVLYTIVCLFVCLSVCLYVCWSISLLSWCSPFSFWLMNWNVPLCSFAYLLR